MNFFLGRLLSKKNAPVNIKNNFFNVQNIYIHPESLIFSGIFYWMVRMVEDLQKILILFSKYNFIYNSLEVSNLEASLGYMHSCLRAYFLFRRKSALICVARYFKTPPVERLLKFFYISKSSPRNSIETFLSPY